MNTTVPTTPADREPNGYAVTAAELRRIADALDTLTTPVKPVSVQLAILPEKTEAAVDAVAVAVLGKPGKGERNGRDWYHVRRTDPNGYAPVSVSVLAVVPGPPDERDAELAELRAENERLRAVAPSFVDDDPTGLGYSREADDPTPTTAVPATVEGHAEFSGRATVPDVTLCLAEVEPATTCDEPIWWNAGANAWWHQSDEHFNHTATGPSVPPSDGGE